jgi:hypothetical protein
MLKMIPRAYPIGLFLFESVVHADVTCVALFRPPQLTCFLAKQSGTETGFWMGRDQSINSKYIKIIYKKINFNLVFFFLKKKDKQNKKIYINNCFIIHFKFQLKQLSKWNPTCFHTLKIINN